MQLNIESFDGKPGVYFITDSNYSHVRIGESADGKSRIMEHASSRGKTNTILLYFLECSNHFEVENLDYDEDRIKDIIKEAFDNIDSKTLSIFEKNKKKYESGGAIEISKSELENIVGRKLNGWNDDNVYHNEKQYKKCYLKPYYKLI